MRYSSGFSTLRQTRIAFCISILYFGSTLAMADEYVVDDANSSLKFIAIQQGIDFEGSFKRFQAQIEFDRSDLADSIIRATVELASVDTQNPDRDSYLLNEEWFNVAAWPTAVFKTHRIRYQDGNRYIANASLTLRDITGPVLLQFSFESMPNGTAHLTGTAELMRLDFGVGQGDWIDTSWIGNPVAVLIDLQLDPADKPQ